jgi:hypothetical protein
MRTTIAIPDEMYRELKSRAALEGETVKALLVRGVEVALRSKATASSLKRRGRMPVLHSTNPGSLKFGRGRCLRVHSLSLMLMCGWPWHMMLIRTMGRRLSGLNPLIWLRSFSSAASPR